MLWWDKRQFRRVWEDGMTVVFEQTLTQSRELALPAGAGEKPSGSRLRALQRLAALCLAQIRLKLAGSAADSRLLSNKAALLVTGDRLLRQTRAAGRPLSLALFEFSDLKEVRSIYGRAV